MLAALLKPQLIVPRRWRMKDMEVA